MSSLNSDWGSLPTTLLNQIIRTILEEYDTVETIVRAYASLAQVCKHWRDAARSTLLCFHLTEPNHLGLTARDWLAAQLLEVLIINRRLAKADEDHRAGEVQSSYEINLRPRGPPTEVPFALDLFSRPAVLANSAKSLTCVVNVPVATAPLLPPFSMLRQVALYSPKVASRSQAIDLGALSTLPRLTCLSLIGYFAPLDWSAVPTTLRHLSVSIYDRDIMESFSSDEVATLFMAELGPDMAPHIVTRAKLPATLPKLEYLSVKADILLIDWDDLMSRCEEVHLSANFLGMGVGQRHDQVAAFATAVAEAQVTDCAVVAFHRVALYESVDSVAPGPSLDHWNVDVDDMLMELRQRAVCTWDMDPVMDAPRDFVNDEGPLVDCFVLTLDRQEGPEPRSFHFTLPLSDSEIELLCGQPTWRLVWCDDPRTVDLLENPTFVATNAKCLERLSRCRLVPGLNLRPFTALRSLHGVVHGPVTSIAFPEGLTSLELEAPPVNIDHGDEGQKFNASCLAPLTGLKDVALTGWARLNLAKLPSTVTSLRIANPAETPENVLGMLCPTTLKLPKLPTATEPIKSPRRNRLIGLFSSLLGQEASSSEGNGGEDVWSDDGDEMEEEGVMPVKGGMGGNDATHAAHGAAVAEPLTDVDMAATQTAAQPIESPTNAALQKAGEQDSALIGEEGMPLTPMEVDSAAASGPGAQSAGSPTPTAQGEERIASGPAGATASAAEGEAEAPAAPTRRRRRCPRHIEDGLDSGAVLVPGTHEDDIYDSGLLYGDLDDSLLSSHAAVSGGPPCDDPHCPVHSGKHHLQITFSDARDSASVDLVQLVTSGFPMISLTLDPPLEAIHAGFHIYLRVGRWDTFINTLKASSLEVLEINHHGNSVAFFNNWHRPGDRHHYLWEGLKSIEEKAGDVFEFRTWDGATSRKGLIQGAECYAVVRKATGQQGGTGAGTADGTAGDGQHVPLDIGDGDDSSGKGLS